MDSLPHSVAEKRFVEMLIRRPTVQPNADLALSVEKAPSDEIPGV
jgi:hypothetical protein